MKWPVLILALQLSFAAGFMSLVTTTASKRLQVRVMTKRVDRNYRSSPRKPKTKKTSHVLSNPYLNTINKPSKRSVLLAYWKKLNARGVTRLVANTLLAYLFVGSASRCIVFSCSWYLASRQVRLPGLFKLVGCKETNRLTSCITFVAPLDAPFTFGTGSVDELFSCS